MTWPARPMAMAAPPISLTEMGNLVDLDSLLIVSMGYDFQLIPNFFIAHSPANSQGRMAAGSSRLGPLPTRRGSFLMPLR